MSVNPLSILLAIGLAACGGGPKKVVVYGSEKDLRFTAVASEGASPACVDKVSVTAVTPEEAEPYWQIVSTHPANCVSTVRYGTATDNFAETAPAVSLAVNVVYRVRVSGAGFSEVRDFRLNSERMVMGN